MLYDRFLITLGTWYIALLRCRYAKLRRDFDSRRIECG